MGFELTGLQEIIDNIELLAERGKAVQNKALRAGAEIFEEEMKNRAPKSSSPVKPSGKQKWRTGDHAYKLLKAGSITTGKEGKHIMVGLQRSDSSKAFYLKFHECGTSKMCAKPFVEPAFEAKKDEVTEVIKVEISKGLGLWT